MSWSCNCIVCTVQKHWKVSERLHSNRNHRLSSHGLDNNLWPAWHCKCHVTFTQNIHQLFFSFIRGVHDTSFFRCIVMRHVTINNSIFSMVAKSQKYNCSTQKLARTKKKSCLDSFKGRTHNRLLASIAAANLLATVTERAVPSSELKSSVWVKYPYH